MINCGTFLLGSSDVKSEDIIQQQYVLDDVIPNLNIQHINLLYNECGEIKQAIREFSHDYLIDFLNTQFEIEETLRIEFNPDSDNPKNLIPKNGSKKAKILYADYINIQNFFSLKLLIASYSRQKTKL